MTTFYDAIVVGLGVMGASTCWRLAQHGARVLGLDAFGVPNTRGSSHGHSRIFRMSYFEHPSYVPLLQAALHGWRELEAAAGRPLLTLCGGLYIGAPDTPLVAHSIAAAELHGLEHTLLDHGTLQARWPQFAAPSDAVAVHEPLAGAVLAEGAVSAMAQLAHQAGAALRTDTPVADWTADSAGVTVHTAGGSFAGRRLIICPGAFAGSLLQTDRIRITPTRRVVGWFAPRRPERAGPASMPIWAAELADGSFYYGLPALPGSPGLKLAAHRAGPVIDPQAEPVPPTVAEHAELTAIARRWLPEDAGELTRAIACPYEESADGHFILAWHPDCQSQPAEQRNVLVFCGGSGHGFKFAPVVGAILAELALTASTAHDISFFASHRFLSTAAR